MSFNTLRVRTSALSNRHPHRRAARGMVSVIAASSLLGLTACGDDSTVDNSQSAPSVPSVSKPADATESQSSESKKDNTSEDTANHGGSLPQDSGAEEVEDVPGGTSRSEQDNDYLKRLKDGGIDLGTVQGAQQPGGVEDQLIAVAHGYCQTKAAGTPDVFTALAAGQLETQGVIKNRKAEEMQPVIADAATEAYCK
ncbi:DUF732 domain-containing protein [Corynebacterium anserum]|uniref:DUF732 domain-containing protein n=1 Tax=Corynebacterium anserum TaxID=2684406 RepID=A0A7G7YLM8_9CORY|nr:DUF732 domain-containing protein [Corynebacterium anserum]QNH95398.1 hypothetical protein GP473_00610 [Corynebacterium anserum]